MEQEMPDLFRQTLHDLGVISASALRLLQADAQVQILPKNSVIIQEGKRNETEYFLLQGVCHRCNINDKGDLVSTGFYIGPGVITPHFARTILKKSLFTLETLTETSLYAIPVKSLDALRRDHPEWNQFGRHVIEKEFAHNLYQDIVNRSLSARERLLALRAQYPNLENLVPHQIIASFLGITKVSFSRLRSELSRQ